MANIAKFPSESARSREWRPSWTKSLNLFVQEGRPHTIFWAQMTCSFIQGQNCEKIAGESVCSCKTKCCEYSAWVYSSLFKNPHHLLQGTLNDIISTKAWCREVWNGILTTIVHLEWKTGKCKLLQIKAEKESGTCVLCLSSSVSMQ